MSIFGMYDPLESPRMRAMELIAQYITVSIRQRAEIARQLEEITAQKPSPIEIAYKAAIVRKSA
ncbi:MAG: hypothetical protein ACOY4F_01240 [Thermodesulfobacteriota bacterium]